MYTTIHNYIKSLLHYRQFFKLISAAVHILYNVTHYFRENISREKEFFFLPLKIQ